MGALLRSQALGGGTGGQSAAGPASGPLSLASRRGLAGGPPRPNLGQMGMGASAPAGRVPGIGGRRGPPGGMTLSGMKGAPTQASENKFSDFGQIM